MKGLLREKRFNGIGEAIGFANSLPSGCKFKGLLSAGKYSEGYHVLYEEPEYFPRFDPENKIVDYNSDYIKRWPAGLHAAIHERMEQIEKHGHTLESDVKHNNYGQLLTAAGILRHLKIMPEDENLLPVYWDLGLWRKMLGKPHHERLVIAACFLLAEYDRLYAKNTF